MAASSLSGEDIKGLQDRFSRLETDVEALTTTLSRISAARMTERTSARRLSSQDGSGKHRATRQELFPSRDSALRTEARPHGHSHVVPVVFVTAGAALVLWRMRLNKKRTQGQGHSRASPTAAVEPGRNRHRERATGGAHAAPCDVAFLAHPGVLLSAFARWLPEKQPRQRWQASWWMVPAWPITLLISAWYMFIAPLFSGPYLLVDRFELKGVANQVWLSRAFGYQFMIKALRPRIARGIEAAVREADKAGVKVLGLGALNKAEFINRGGQDVLESFTPRTTRLLHGNTLTAAVVVENVKAAVAANPAVNPAPTSAFPPGSCGAPGGSSATTTTRKPCVFLTGATSKVGRAVALRLALDGFNVVCCTSSDDRFASLQRELCLFQRQRQQQPQQQQQQQAEQRPRPVGGREEGRLLRANRVDEGVHFRLWVVGKFDTSVRLHIPLKAAAVVFAVPCPLEGHRPDVSTVTGGIVRMDVSLCSPRNFHVLLPFDQLYACHAAAIVHHRMGWTHHEVGKIDIGRMENTLLAAKDCGFSVPFSRSSSPTTVVAECPRADGGGDALGGGHARYPCQNKTTGSAGRFCETERPREGAITLQTSDSVEAAVQQQRQRAGRAFLPRPDGVSARETESRRNGGRGRSPADSEGGDGDGGEAVTVLGEEGGWQEEIGSRSSSTATLLASSSSSSSSSSSTSSNSGRPRSCVERGPSTAALAASAANSLMEAGNRRGEEDSINAIAQNGLTRAPPMAVVQGTKRRRHENRSTWGTPRRERDEGYSSSSTDVARDARKDGQELLSDRDAGTCVSNDSDIFEQEHLPNCRRPPASCRVVVVGAGASGLSAAACLRTRGEDDVVILERSDSVCGAWSRQYEGLRITTRRAHCGLPGWPVPSDGFCDSINSTTKSGNNTSNGNSKVRTQENEMSAESFVRYLRAYRRRFDLDVFTDTDVLGAVREASFASCEEGEIVVRCRRRGELGVSTIRCEHLVVATGKCSSPRMPVTVLQTLHGFSGEVLHSSETTGLASRAARGDSICIVGMGNSACDLAVALLANGAEKVHISTRSAPPIIMRQWGPLSLEWVSRAVQFLPARATDHVLSIFGAAKWGRGWRAKIFPPGVQQTWGACASNRIPCIDKGSLVPALLNGEIVVHGPIDWANDRTLRFRHTGATAAFGTVILATGFDSRAHQGWLDPSLFDEHGQSGAVHMVGFDNGRALLPLRQIGADARRVAARITPRCRRPTPAMSKA